jgi:hypothetical protein
MKSISKLLRSLFKMLKLKLLQRLLPLRKKKKKLKLRPL